MKSQRRESGLYVAEIELPRGARQLCAQRPEYRRLRRRQTANSIHFEVEPGLYEAHVWIDGRFRRQPRLGLTKALKLIRNLSCSPQHLGELLATLPLATVLTLQPPDLIQPAGLDTFIASGSATGNFGSNAELRFGIYTTFAPGIVRPLIKFVPGLPAGAQISSTVLTVTLAAAGGTFSSHNNSFSVHRVKRAWNGSQATWNVYSTGNNWGTAGCDNTTTDREAGAIGTSGTFTNGDAVGKTYNVSLTGSSWDALDLGNGWVVIASDEVNSPACFRLASSDHATASYRPKLVITYTVPSGSNGAFRPAVSEAFHGAFI